MTARDATTEGGQPESWELWLAAGLVLAALCFSLLDRTLWHAAYFRVDEESVLARLQMAREGVSAFGWRPLTGNLTAALQAAASRLLGPSLEAARLPVTLAFLAEAPLLWLVARRWGGPRAGVWAVAAHAGAAFTLMRLRGLLSFTLLPVELLALWAAMPWARGRVRSAVWGLAAGAMLLDYEGWLVGLPVLALLWAASGRDERPLPGWAAAGLAAALAGLAAAHAQVFALWFAVRAEHTLPTAAAGWGQAAQAARGLAGYWFGGNAMPAMGVGHHPGFPLWAWPGLALGLWALARRRAGWLLAALAVGLAPLALRSGVVECNRAAAAWPVLCVAAGVGMAALPRAWFGARRAAAVLALAVALGAAFEASAYWRHMEASWHRGWAYGAARLQAAAWARTAGAGPALTRLDLRSEGAAFRYLCGGGGAPGEGRLALIPAARLPRVAGRQPQGWFVFGAGDRFEKAWLLEPEPALLGRLRAHDAALERLARGRAAAGIEARREWALRQLDDPANTAGWVRTALWAEWADAVAYQGGADPARVAALLREDLWGAEAPLNLARQLAPSDPALARACLLKARAVDPDMAVEPELAALLAPPAPGQVPLAIQPKKRY